MVFQSFITTAQDSSAHHSHMYMEGTHELQYEVQAIDRFNIGYRSGLGDSISCKRTTLRYTHMCRLTLEA